MCEVAETLTKDVDLQKSIALSSLEARRDTHAINKTVIGFCQTCFAPLHVEMGLCGECQALAARGWLEIDTTTVKVGELAFPTNAAVAADPQLSEWWKGVHVASIDEKGVATVKSTTWHTVHVSKLTTNLGRDVYDPML